MKSLNIAPIELNDNQVVKRRLTQEFRLYCGICGKTYTDWFADYTEIVDYISAHMKHEHKQSENASA